MMPFLYSLVGQFVRERTARFLRNLKRAATHPDDEAIHDLRVSVRRLIAALSVARDEARSERAAAALTALDALMKPLGKLRDVQVQLERLKALDPRKRKVLAAFFDQREERERRLQAKCRKAMKKFHPARIRKACKQVRGEMEERGRKGYVSGRSATNTAYRVVLRAFRAMRRFRDAALRRRDVRAFHRMRLALKRLRYTAEIFEGLLPGLGKRRLKFFDRLQTYMGEVHDLDVLREDIAEFYGPELPSDVQRVSEHLKRQRDRLFAQFATSFARMDKDPFWTMKDEASAVMRDP